MVLETGLLAVSGGAPGLQSGWSETHPGAGFQGPTDTAFIEEYVIIYTDHMLARSGGRAILAVPGVVRAGSKLV